MVWTQLLSVPQEHHLPWTGGRAVHSRGRSWTLSGALPPEHGWHRFAVSGSRRARWIGPGSADFDFEQEHPLLRGYLVGDRLVPDHVAVLPDVHRAFEQSERLWLVEPGLERFCRVLAARLRDGRLLYLRPEFPLGPEPEVTEAWQDGLDSIAQISEVSPALDLAFRWLVWRRAVAAERAETLRREAEEAAELERLLVEEERQLAEQAAQAERRALLREQLRRQRAAQARRGRRGVSGFNAQAAQALAVSGAELLDCRASRNRGEMVVQFRFQRRRFECVVRREGLRVVDSGICLTDARTGERGDNRFTLESLPAVIAEAIRTDVLHVYRHVR